MRAEDSDTSPIRSYEEFKAALDDRADKSQSPLMWTVASRRCFSPTVAGEWLMRWVEEERDS